MKYPLGILVLGTMEIQKIYLHFIRPQTDL